MSADLNALPPSVRALAEADFTHVGQCFADAGFAVQLPAPGILQVRAPTRASRRQRLLLSVGVHGDETAPIEILACLLETLRQEPHALAVDLMAVVGNPLAIAQGKRFVDDDLNRLFHPERTAAQGSVEVQRAAVIMRAAADFFAGPDAENWHLDLHTAIRASYYPTFAVVPNAIQEARKQALLGWLGQAGIGAAILNPLAASTFSFYTATSFGAASATVELGQVGTLGGNDLSQFGKMQRTLEVGLRSGMGAAGGLLPDVFKVVTELVKRSDAFRPSFDHGTKNFTPMAPGTVVAKDGGTVYRVGPETEYVVFPNPDVRIGLRAGLMVVRTVKS